MPVTTRSRFAFVGALALSLLAGTAAAQPPAGWVTKQQKITEGVGGFTHDLASPGLFGVSSTPLGDLDGDGVTDLAVGAYVDSEYVPYAGAVYIVFRKPDGTVKSYTKIGSNHGGLNVTLEPLDFFGWSVGNIGDLDGDGVTDLAVGAWLDDELPLGDQGAVYILFLKPDGTVKTHRRITTGVNGFTATLYSGHRFGTSIAVPGDVDGDGVQDLLIGALYDHDPAYLAGATFLLFMNTNGTVREYRKITMGQGGFFDVLDKNDRFGYSACALGDLDLNGTGDVAVGSLLDNDGGPQQGSVHVIFLDSTGWVIGNQKISATSGNFGGDLDPIDQFGCSVTAIPDIDGDGIVELAVGAMTDDDSGPERGAVWILNLNRDGTVKSHTKISGTAGGFDGAALADLDRFGQSIACLGDPDGDGQVELCVGADHDDDGGADAGAVYVLTLARSAWTHKGGGLAGSNGIPNLAGSGTLAAGSSTTLTLSGANPDSLGLLLFGVSTLQLPPSLGSLLIPNFAWPGFMVTIGTGPFGGWSLTSTWPGGAPSGFQVYSQVFVVDPASSIGFSASNLQQGTVP